MKEIITIKIKCKTISKARKEVVKIQEYANNENFDCIVGKTIGQLPETWEELKELCKDLRHIQVYDSFICFENLEFWNNWEIRVIDSKETITLVNKRTPAQMWQIIKALVVD